MWVTKPTEAVQIAMIMKLTPAHEGAIAKRSSWFT